MIHKIKLLLAAACLTASIQARAQQIPKGYTVQDEGSGKNQLLADLDGDGQKDLFAVIEGSDKTTVYASLKNDAVKLFSKDASQCCNSLTLEKGIVVLHSKGMRGFSTWRFRYNPALKNFQLIGWDTESFGNALNDGSGNSSFNLLTGTFIAKYNSWNEKQNRLIALPTVNKKLKVSRRILLTDFGDDSDDWLFTLTHKELPKAVQ